MTNMEKELALDFFKERGFIRKTCRSCGEPFWTLQPEMDLCQDTPCVEYGFIGEPIIKKELDVDAMRELYLSFFERHGHTRIERYPVAARWRKDIYLTIASIADFQPHVTSGLVPPPANPLTISQPCIRLNDLDSVGKTGRHLSTFEMMAHHAFNNEDKQVYWKDETADYCFRLFTEDLGITPEWITYKESPWAGGGNAGPAFEVLVKGLELSTLVFMNLREDPAGTVDIKGTKYSPLSQNIVDTGYGLERFAWASSGTPSLYDCLWPDLLEEISSAVGVNYLGEEHRSIFGEYVKLAGIMDLESGARLRDLRMKLIDRMAEKGIKTSTEEVSGLLDPLERIYTIADHSRTMAFMLGDGIVPSNVKAGYLTRLIIRRALRTIEELGLEMELADLVSKQISSLRAFPDIQEREDTIRTVLELEQQRYRETVEKGKRIVRGYARERGRSDGLTVEELLELYDTHGLHPSVVKAVGEREGLKVEVPDTWASQLSEMHSKDIAPEKTSKEETGHEFDPTRKLYYEDSECLEFDAAVIAVEKDEVALDATSFYPEGGGQPSDVGVLRSDGSEFKVTAVRKENDVIWHRVEGTLKVGARVEGTVDRQRRMALTRHHSATHVILGAAKKVLGDHVWQSGAQKGLDSARLDVSHYRRITPKEIELIEDVANRTVLEGLPVHKNWMDRMEAEKTYGFRLYQGGVPPGKDIRVVHIPGHDAEACAGTHVDNTREIGSIRILRTERLQDGVERLEFAAGMAAVRYNQQIERIVTESCSILSVKKDQLPRTVKRFFDEWKLQQKELENVRHQQAAKQVNDSLSDSLQLGDVKAVVKEVSGGMKALMALSRELTREEKVLVFLASPTDNGVKLLCAHSGDVNTDCSKLLTVAAEEMEGSGGGRFDFSQGAAPRADRLPEALQKVRAELKKTLGA